MAIDVLVVGSGAREHALAWKLKQSARVGKIYIAPGNGGTSNVAENVPIAASDLENLAKFAEEKKIGMTVVGPDAPLALGIVDLFRARGLRIFGPTKAATQIEASKSFSKQFMQEEKIPTAQFKTFSSYQSAMAYLRVQSTPIVVKASGLALGKGVYVCKTPQEAEAALKSLMIDRVHGDAGAEVVIEAYLDGPEFSIHAFTDDLNSVMFPASQDHKRALDNDEGKNTGGMGAVAPVPWISPDLINSIQHSIVRPALEGMLRRGLQFEGLLYPGVILTVDGPKVLEFNARFGDPETQVYMRLLQSDLLDLLEASIDKTLGNVQSSGMWARGFAANVVLASGGYPDEYKKGLPITGIEAAEAMEDIIVFHAGTVFDGSLKTAGGRVLSVTAFGLSPKEAVNKAYVAVEKIHFEGMQYRKDIGASIIRYYNSVRV